MKSNGILKPMVAIFIGIFAHSFCASPSLAAEKQTHLVAGWDMGFFSSQCLGSIQPVYFTEDTLGEIKDITADDIKRSSASIVVFKGNVKLGYGLKTISADTAELNESENTFFAKGEVRYQDQQLKLTTNAMQFNFSAQTAATKQTKFQLVNGLLRGEAESINLLSGQPLNITGVSITSCPPGNEDWILKSSSIKIDHDNGIGTAKNVVLRINDFPVFYFPSISFPIDDRRSSGFLYPSIGSSSRNGLELELPWYWNIASDKDATFGARYLSKRGLMLDAQYRQLTKNSYSELFAEYLDSDDKGLAGQDDRFFYRLNSVYSSGENWRGNIDLSSVSDDDYFYDFGGNYTSGNRNYLRREAKLSFNSRHISFSGILSNDHLLSAPEEAYSRLPQLRLSFLYPDGFSGLTTNLYLEATSFRHQDLVEAERIVIVPELSFPMNWPSGYIKPKLKLHYTHYSQDDPLNNLPEKVSRTLPILSLDSTMVFERQFEFAKRSFVQTLEPRLFYLYVPQRQQNDIAIYDTNSVENGVDSLFRENRYSGFDRIGDSNQLSVALSSRFYDQASGRERMAITIGRAYYFDDRKVNFAILQNGAQAIDLGVDKRKKSALITNVHIALYDKWWLKGELEYDESANQTEKGVLGLHYRSTDLVLNIRHRINRFNGVDDIEQAELSFSWKMSEELSFVGRWQQDIRQNRTIDSFAGLEYESCCWAIRLVARRYLNVRLDQQGNFVPGTNEFNTGLYLEFVLKGLTNIGNGLNLDNDIQGYEDSYKNY